MTSIWFPNNKYPPNTKNYLPCFVLGGGLVLGGRDYTPFGILSKTYNIKAIAGNESGELFQEELAAPQDLNNSPPH